jgi:hypothetical protein
MTHHGGGIKKAIAVIAVIAIPIAAPMIASSLVASTALGAAVTASIGATATAVVSSAIVGAGLGAITAKVTGGDVKAGAISGLIGGGIGGYTSASKPGMFGNAATPTASSGTVTNLDGSSVGSGTTSSGLPDGVTNASLNTAGTDGLSNAVVTTGTDAVVEESFSASLKKGLSSAGEKIVDKFTNPDALANAVLQVGGAVAAEAIVGTPDQSPEATAAIEEYKQELQALKAKDEAAFNQKMDAAKQYMVQAGYYDPQYFGLQAANRAAITEGRKLREFERKAGLKSGGVSSGDRRRAALSGSKNVQTAFDTGFVQGIGLKDKALSTGVGLIPAGSPTAANAAGKMASYYLGLDAKANADANRKKDNIQKLFGGFNTQTGLDKKEKEERNKKAGLDTTGGGLPNSFNNNKPIPV